MKMKVYLLNDENRIKVYLLGNDETESLPATE